MHHQFIPDSAEYDDEVARRAAKLIGLGGKYDLTRAINIQEAICEAPPEFWQELAQYADKHRDIGATVTIRVRDYYTKMAEEYVKEELDDERQRPQDPELA